MELLQVLSDMLFGTPAYADAASINPNAVAYTESRGMSKKQKMTPGAAGEIGTYQIRPIMFKDLQRLMPDKYKNMNFFDTAVNDDLASKAMMDYFNKLENHYAKIYKINPTDENLLQMYNVGPVGFKRGSRNPKYVETYNQGLKEK